MKRSLALLLTLVMSLGLLAGCGSKDTNGANSSTGSGNTSGGTSQGTAAPASDMRVDVFYYDFSDIYISTVRAAMDEQLKAMGIEVVDTKEGASWRRV